jgi:hypothetical protein
MRSTRRNRAVVKRSYYDMCRECVGLSHASRGSKYIARNPTISANGIIRPAAEAFTASIAPSAARRRCKPQYPFVAMS